MHLSRKKNVQKPPATGAEHVSAVEPGVAHEESTDELHYVNIGRFSVQFALTTKVNCAWRKWAGHLPSAEDEKERRKKLPKTSPSRLLPAHTWKLGHYFHGRCLVRQWIHIHTSVWVAFGQFLLFLRELGPRIRGRFCCSRCSRCSLEILDTSRAPGLAARCSVSGSSVEYRNLGRPLLDMPTYSALLARFDSGYMSCVSPGALGTIFPQALRTWLLTVGCLRRLRSTAWEMTSRKCRCILRSFLLVGTRSCVSLRSFHRISLIFNVKMDLGSRSCHLKIWTLWRFTCMLETFFW